MNRAIIMTLSLMMVNVKPVQRDYFQMGKENPATNANQMKFCTLMTHVKNVQGVLFQMRTVDFVYVVHQA